MEKLRRNHKLIFILFLIFFLFFCNFIPNFFHFFIDGLILLIIFKKNWWIVNKALNKLIHIFMFLFPNILYIFEPFSYYSFFQPHLLALLRI